MKDVNAEQSLVQCNDRDNINPTNIDPVPLLCGDDGWPSQKRVDTNPPRDWSQRPTFKKVGPPQPVGQHGQCDPFQTGQIINDLDTPNRNYIYRYSRVLRGCDEGMYDLFRNIQCIDEQGQAHIVPLVWASQEKAVAAIMQDNVRKDDSLVVNRIRLPIIALWNSGMQHDWTRFSYQRNFSLMPWLDPLRETGFHFQEEYPRDTIYGVTRGIPIDRKYTLYLWTLYQEDMSQIIEQVMLRFSMVAYIRIRGVWWETIVTLDNQSNTTNVEVGNEKLRVLKYQFEMTVKTWMPQPIIRLKSLAEADLPNKPQDETELPFASKESSRMTRKRPQYL